MNRRLALLLLVAFVIKLIFLALDSEPSFYFGDSADYLTTAIGKWIPPDGSFTYGLFLRPVTVWLRSLEPIVLIQAFLSALASWLVGVCLMRYFSANFGLAAALSIACAFEPLQLMSERYLLPDSIATFLFAIFLLATFAYLKSGSLSLLALIQLLGVSLISLRLYFLPIALIASLLLPVISRRAVSFWRSSLKTGRVNWLRGLRFVLTPLVFSVVVSQTLLYGYRSLYGALRDKPPAYTYRGGLSMVADLAPLIQPIDYPDAATRNVIFENLRFSLTNPDTRSAQRWMEGGLCETIRHALKGELRADRLARETALGAIRRDPAGLLKLAAFNYSEYFDYSKLKWNLERDQGQWMAFTAHEAPINQKIIEDVFGVNVDKQNFGSLTKRWQGHCGIWCEFLMILPLLFLIYVVTSFRNIAATHVICEIFALTLLTEVILAVLRPSPRHLAPLAWLAFMLIGSALSGMKRRIRLRQSSRVVGARSAATG